jgi:hypothetical protein
MELNVPTGLQMSLLEGQKINKNILWKYECLDIGGEIPNFDGIEVKISDGQKYNITPRIDNKYHFSTNCFYQ